MRILFMAGGTGGHVIPALTVANYLKQQGHDIRWLGTKQGIEARLVPAAGISIDYMGIKGIRGKAWLDKLVSPFRLLAACFQAGWAIKKWQPDCVVGMGGFASGPGGLMARLLKKPLIIHEQNAVAGKTNQWLAHIATQVFSAYPQAFSKSSKDAMVVGNPVRPAILALAPAFERIQHRTGSLRCLILGGSQGARIFNELIPAVFEGLSVEVWHQTGRGNLDAVSAQYERLGVKAQVSDFIDDMTVPYQWAEVVITRAGALTLAELVAVGLPSILIPYPHAVDDHQTKNAQFLVESGAANRIQQKEFQAVVLRAILSEFCGNRAGLLNMAVAARRLRSEQATSTIAKLILGLKK